MKKSHIAILIVFLICIPLTLYFGTITARRSFYVTGTLVIIELMVPFFMAFEGRKPQARELVIIAVLSALGVASRVLVPLPHFKPAFAIILLAGMAFGPESGFMVGAITAFAGNFFMGQGPFTPWQMMAYGAGGMLAGFIFQKKLLPKKPWVMAVFGFVVCVVWIGPLLDCSQIFLMLSEINWEGVAASFAAGFPVNVSQGVCTAIVMFLFGRPILEKLDRVKIKYGMMEDADGV